MKLPQARGTRGLRCKAAAFVAAASVSSFVHADPNEVVREGGGVTRCCAVVELRQYTLHPDRFERFNDLFEREFIEPQEAAGMTVIGQFRDLDDPNRFVWLRGFPDMSARARSLETFYGGALWKSLRDEANANFVDTDNVLLLKPAMPAAQFHLAGFTRAAPSSVPEARGFVIATIYSLKADNAGHFADYFEREAQPTLVRAGIEPKAAFETDAAPNNFPRLPVREGEHVFVWIATFVDRRRGDAALQLIAATTKRLRPWLNSEPQVLRLEPTQRSLLRGDS